ncbi:hypothetical protein DVH05_017710 [Phytophthora capsici]|nr:hypothetical protein DVH05_015067 [Phytophthora capsici]KAG1696800.1 hypothetical protein DVH05_017710 [Phytophthora capsici]
MEKPFKQIWRELTKKGWKARRPKGLSVDYTYVPPQGNEKGEEGVDYFIVYYGTAEIKDGSNYLYPHSQRQFPLLTLLSPPTVPHHHRSQQVHLQRPDFVRVAQNRLLALLLQISSPPLKPPPLRSQAPLPKRLHVAAAAENAKPSLQEARLPASAAKKVCQHNVAAIFYHY